MSSITFLPAKIQYKDKGTTWYGLEVADYLIPFPVPPVDDEEEELVVTLTVGDEVRELERDTHYFMDRSSLLRIINKSLGLTQADPLSLSLNISVRRTTSE